MRAVYKSKHDTLLSELKRLKGVKKIFGERSGVHVLVQMAGGMSEQELAGRAERAGVRVYPLSEYCIGGMTYEPTVILGYATMKVEAIPKAAALLAGSWET